MDDIFKGVGVEIELPTPDNFLKIKETLTRIGIASRKEKKLWQSCHILHKQGRYVVLHFKELFVLDGKDVTLSDEDLARRNTITKLLEDWGLLKIVEETDEDEFAPINHIKIISHKEKNEWQLYSKYEIGKKKG